MHVTWEIILYKIMKYTVILNFNPNCFIFIVMKFILHLCIYYLSNNLLYLNNHIKFCIVLLWYKKLITYFFVTSLFSFILLYFLIFLYLFFLHICIKIGDKILLRRDGRESFPDSPPCRAAETRLPEYLSK
jgi:hypothetical protein